MKDSDVQKKSGIYAYVLDGDEHHLGIRAFDENTKREVYEEQEGRCKICGRPFEIEQMEADQLFVETYREVPQFEDGMKLRNKSAYKVAAKANSVEAYKNFINKYPKADEVSEAWNNVYSIDYTEAKKIHTSDALARYINLYPKSYLLDSAQTMYDKLLWEEKTDTADWRTYTNFIESYPKSPYRRKAAECLYTIVCNT